jgi:hypothetical protein
VRSPRCLLVVFVLAFLLAVAQVSQVQGATRHHSYIGTISAISASSLVIYSKAHRTSFQFVVNSQTKFLQSGKAISRFLFRKGSYVTVSYSAGPHGTLIAWHVSLRKA